MRGRRAGRALRALALLEVACACLVPAARAVEPEAGVVVDPTPGPSPVVAVLPFEVNSAQPIDYLGDSLADLLRTRLEAGGRLRVVDAPSSRLDVRPRSGETADAAVRRVARSQGADYVVTGNLTELAGRFSLHVRTVAASLGVESVTQVLPAQREEELLGRVNQLADRITEQILGATPAKVVDVVLRGAPGFEGELLPSLRTQPGAPYEPDTIRADIAALRANPAVLSADAEVLRTDEGAVVSFTILLADPGDVTPLVAGAVILEVRIRGNRRIESDAIRARIATEAGGRFDPIQVSRDVQEIHSLGFFRNVRAWVEETPEGRILIYEVEENPVVRQISLAGNENIESDKVRDILTLTTGASLDYPLLFENRERIEGLYRAEGYYLADVSFEIEPLTEGSVGVHFDIDEKEKLKLRSIEFVGNEHIDNSELTAEFQTKTWKFWSYATSWYDRSGTYSEPLFIQDLRGVEKRYTDDGFLQVEIGQPEVIPSEDGLSVSVPVNEGRRFKVGAIDVAGDTTVDIEALRQKLQLKEGAIFNRSHLTDDIAALTEHYQDRGFYFAQVTPLSNLSEANEIVDLTFDVRKGPLYFIRKVEVGGNTITVDSVIRREMPIVEGQLYSQRAILLARQKVQRLGFFEEVDFQMKPTEEPDQLDIEVSVVERPTGSFSFGAGFSSQDGLVLTGSLSQSNLFGRGYAANISLDFGSQTERFFINLSDPYFMDSSFSLGATFSRTKVRFDSFDQEQLGADLVVGHALNEENTARGFLRYSFNLRKLADDNRVSAAALIFREVLQDVLSSSTVGLSVLSDTRDDRLAPTSGSRHGFTIEGAGLGGFSKFIRFEGRSSWYLGAPRWMPDRSSFVFAARAGWAVPLNVLSDFATIEPTAIDQALFGSDQVRALDTIDTDLTLPLTERYFLGGLGQFQLRGYRARSVGPRRPILKLTGVGNNGLGSLFSTLGYDAATQQCADIPGGGLGGNGNGICNNLNATEIDEFADIEETDVIGGNKFFTTSFEYRFPISETVGLQGVVFIDMGNAFDENTLNLFDVTRWRYGTGAGIQWFSPFGPLAVVLGFPLNKLSIEDSPVFEFSVGGVGF